MKRASSVDLRKAKYLVEEFVRAGIDFVPIPVIDQDDKNELAMDLHRRLEQIEKDTSNEQCHV